MDNTNRVRMDEWTDSELLHHIYRDLAEVKDAISKMEDGHGELSHRVTRLEAQNTTIKWLIGVLIGAAGVILAIFT